MTVEIHPYSCFAGNIRDFKVKRCDGNGDVKKKKTGVIISYFTENVNKQRRNFISFSELGYGP